MANIGFLIFHLAPDIQVPDSQVELIVNRPNLALRTEAELAAADLPA